MHTQDAEVSVSSRVENFQREFNVGKHIQLDHYVLLQNPLAFIIYDANLLGFFSQNDKF